MKALHDFLSMGVDWIGTVPATPGTKETELDADEALNRRHVRVVLLHIASRYPTRAAQIERGLQLSRQDLSNRLYSLPRVADALNILQRAGIVYRERQRGGAKGTEHEERARTHIHPNLIDQARAWDSERAERYKRGLRGAAAFAKKTVAIHLVWNGTPRDASNDAASREVCVLKQDGSASQNKTHLSYTPPRGKPGEPLASDIELRGMQHTEPPGAPPIGGRRAYSEGILH